jgi:hypothetical protein
MAEIEESIKLNYADFCNSVPAAISENIKKTKDNKLLLESYALIASINSLKLDLISRRFSEGSARFFFEAHNDILLSHVHASYGCWKSALQSLRGFLENSLSSIYYHDHPVELQKWKAGKYRISPRDLREYIYTHPKIELVAAATQLPQALEAEYVTLSRAVHSANDLFRMTKADGSTNIGTPKAAELGKWTTREKTAINIISTVLIAFLSDELEGAKLLLVRKALSRSVSPKHKTKLKQLVGVTIPSN